MSTNLTVVCSEDMDFDGCIFATKKSDSYEEFVKTWNDLAIEQDGGISFDWIYLDYHIEENEEIIFWFFATETSRSFKTSGHSLSDYDTHNRRLGEVDLLIGYAFKPTEIVGQISFGGKKNSYHWSDKELKKYDSDTVGNFVVACECTKLGDHYTIDCKGRVA